MQLNDKVTEKLKELLTPDCYEGNALKLEVLLKKMDLSEFEVEFVDPQASGGIFNDESGKWAIYVNQEYPMTRKRFIIAHEIGHYISAICDSYSAQHLSAHEQCVCLARTYTQNDTLNGKAELEASQIAFEMLIPEKQIIQYVKKSIYKTWLTHIIKTPCSISTENIANEFNVSVETAAIRLNRLGINIL